LTKLAKRHFKTRSEEPGGESEREERKSKKKKSGKEPVRSESKEG